VQRYESPGFLIGPFPKSNFYPIKRHRKVPKKKPASEQAALARSASVTRSVDLTSSPHTCIVSMPIRSLRILFASILCLPYRHWRQFHAWEKPAHERSLVLSYIVKVMIVATSLHASFRFDTGRRGGKNAGGRDDRVVLVFEAENHP
jgi:hypothetical protein